MPLKIKTKIFERFQDTICIKREVYNLVKRDINSTLRNLFGKKRVEENLKF